MQFRELTRGQNSNGFYLLALKLEQDVPRKPKNRRFNQFKYNFYPFWRVPWTVNIGLPKTLIGVENFNWRRKLHK